VEVLCRGGGPAPPLWRRRTRERDADAHRRQALGELQQQRPLESSSHRTVATLGDLQQQLVVGVLQQQRPYQLIVVFLEREKNEGRREVNGMREKRNERCRTAVAMKFSVLRLRLLNFSRV
jgi:hypothetical protein